MTVNCKVIDKNYSKMNGKGTTSIIEKMNLPFKLFILRLLSESKQLYKYCKFLLYLRVIELSD